ncbi:MAG TPA: hypothetical protein VHX64_00160, partial [Caulobacteraceae bacterium]|nr:hypothetical protein [Caulobacteraceae bacterium]
MILSAASAAALTALASTAALAQQAPASGPTPAPAAGSNQVGEVVITGSRIVRRDFTSESPIVTAS